MIQQLPLAPVGVPDTYGWYQGVPVLFDAAGLPCTASDLAHTLTLLDTRLAELQGALAVLAEAAALRRAMLARLQAMEGGDGC